MAPPGLNRGFEPRNGPIVTAGRYGMEESRQLTEAAKKAARLLGKGPLLVRASLVVGATRTPALGPGTEKVLSMLFREAPNSTLDCTRQHPTVSDQTERSRGTTATKVPFTHDQSALHPVCPQQLTYRHTLMKSVVGSTFHAVRQGDCARALDFKEESE